MERDFGSLFKMSKVQFTWQLVGHLALFAYHCRCSPMYYRYWCDFWHL